MIDAYELSDAGIESAAMERAVMMAYRMMANRREKLKTQLNNIKSAEDEMLLLEKATEDLTQSYRENVSTSFIHAKAMSFILLMFSFCDL